MDGDSQKTNGCVMMWFVLQSKLGQNDEGIT